MFQKYAVMHNNKQQFEKKDVCETKQIKRKTERYDNWKGLYRIVVLQILMWQQINQVNNSKSSFAKMH